MRYQELTLPCSTWVYQKAEHRHYFFSAAARTVVELLVQHCFCDRVQERATVAYSVLESTVMCLNIGTPKNNKFSFVPNWKINYNYFQMSKNLGKLTIIGLNIGTPKNH